MGERTYIHPLNFRNADVLTQKPQIAFELPYIGHIRTRNANEIKSSNWMLGCETLDRDFADYDQYKEYLCPLGIKLLRFQGGWAKTEKKQGVYSWEWLDHIIEDTVERGLKPWIQTGYGNPIYQGAGGTNLGAGMPLSQEGLAAYEKWVTAMVFRYFDKVNDWEVWNEPNFSDNEINTPEITADFNIRTAKIIKGIQPDAKISALALGHIDLEYVERFFKYLSAHNGCELFHNVTYHDYVYNPDSNKLAVYKMREIVNNYAPKIVIRQGENGAPSVKNAGGALANYDWSEVSQAKWDVRRMLENLGNRIECSVFSIAEMQYKGDGPINKKNTKGLLETAPDKRVIRPKIAYYAVQNVVSVFDDSLEQLRNVEHTCNIGSMRNNSYWINTDRSISVYGYQNKENKKRLFTIWVDCDIPKNTCELKYHDFVFANSQFEKPVLVDILTGDIFEIPANQWKRKENKDYFTNIPVYDSPVLIADKDLIFSIYKKVY